MSHCVTQAPPQVRPPQEDEPIYRELLAELGAPGTDDDVQLMLPI